MVGSSLGPRLNTTGLRLRNTRRQGSTSIPDSVRRSRAAAGDPLELLGVLHSTKRGDGDSSPSSDDDETDEYRVEPRDRKRKCTDRGSDSGSTDDEQEIERSR